jgi:hypothetical protein
MIFPILLPGWGRQQFALEFFGSALLAFFDRVLLRAVRQFSGRQLGRPRAERAIRFRQQENVFR